LSEQGRWCTITEYSQLRSLSVSTIRRYIKANRVKHKLVDGKYFIMIGDQRLKQAGQKEEKEILRLQLENDLMRRELKLIKQELEDQKMLLSIYEREKIPSLPPNLPGTV